MRQQPTFFNREGRPLGCRFLSRNDRGSELRDTGFLCGGATCSVEFVSLECRLSDHVLYQELAEFTFARVNGNNGPLSFPLCLALVLSVRSFLVLKPKAKSQQYRHDF